MTGKPTPDDILASRIAAALHPSAMPNPVRSFGSFGSVRPGQGVRAGASPSPGGTERTNQIIHAAHASGSTATIAALALVAVAGCSCWVLAKSPAARKLAAEGLRRTRRRFRRAGASVGLWARFRFPRDKRYIRLAIRLEKSRWNAAMRNANLSKDATARKDGGYLRRGSVRRVDGGARVVLHLPAGVGQPQVRKQLPVIQAHLGLPTGTRYRFQPGTRDDRLVLHVRFDAVARTIPWTPPAGPVRLADPMPLSVTAYGDTVHLDLKNRIGIFGTSGSGKSCVQRLIGARVILAQDADLDIWDLKQGLESQHYAGKAHRVTTVADAVDRTDWLLGTEFPRRAERMHQLGTANWRETPQDPALVLLVDEGNVLFRGFTAAQWDKFLTVAEQGRALGVYVVWATQYPKATNLPTALRSQLNVRICLQLISSEESAVVFKDEVANGWAPHTLAGSGALLVKSAAHRSPEESQAYWLDEDVFASLPVTGTGGRVGFTKPLAPVPAGDTGKVRIATAQPQERVSSALAVPPMPTYAPTVPAVPAPAQAPGRRTLADAVADVLELLGTPMGVTELTAVLGLRESQKSSVGTALKKLVADGRVTRDGSRYSAITSVNAEEEEGN